MRRLASLIRFAQFNPLLPMLDDRPDLPEDIASPGSSRAPERNDANHSAFHKPRVKLVDTGRDLTPAGATYLPPTPSPLPDRGAGLLLFLSFASAITAVTFAVLIAYKS